jgi:phage terminase large subunit GpA-like protein
VFILEISHQQCGEYQQMSFGEKKNYRREKRGKCERNRKKDKDEWKIEV